MAARIESGSGFLNLLQELYHEKQPVPVYKYDFSKYSFSSDLQTFYKELCVLGDVIQQNSVFQKPDDIDEIVRRNAISYAQRIAQQDPSYKETIEKIKQQYPSDTRDRNIAPPNSIKFKLPILPFNERESSDDDFKRILYFLHFANHIKLFKEEFVHKKQNLYENLYRIFGAEYLSNFYPFSQESYVDSKGTQFQPQKVDDRFKNDEKLGRFKNETIFENEREDGKAKAKHVKIVNVSVYIESFREYCARSGSVILGGLEGIKAAYEQGVVDGKVRKRPSGDVSSASAAASGSYSSYPAARGDT